MLPFVHVAPRCAPLEEALNASTRKEDGYGERANLWPLRHTIFHGPSAAVAIVPSPEGGGMHMRKVHYAADADALLRKSRREARADGIAHRAGLLLIHSFGQPPGAFEVHARVLALSALMRALEVSRVLLASARVCVSCPKP